jgi:hypothetical protein
MPTEPASPASTPLLLCGIGMLLTVVEVNGFGADIADDSIGFALVAVGAARCAGQAGRRWCIATAAAAAVAAVVSLFAYGGPAGLVTQDSFTVWHLVFLLETAATAGVVAGVLLIVWSTSGARRTRALPALAAACVCAAAVQIGLFDSPAAYIGPLGYVRQSAGVMIGLLHSLTVVAAFTAACTRTAESGQNGPVT